MVTPRHASLALTRAMMRAFPRRAEPLAAVPAKVSVAKLPATRKAAAKSRVAPPSRAFTSELFFRKAQELRERTAALWFGPGNTLNPI